MSPKEKAIELINKYTRIDTFVMTTRHNYLVPKQCAIICVNEIIDCGNLEFMTIQVPLYKNLYEYWNEVVKEIKLL